MQFHPMPQAGEARPWAFPTPERGALDNGLTVLRCHRPGQQLVAVEVLLDAPLDAEPAGLDGVATIMARAFSEGTDKHTAEEFAAELERCGATLDAHADHPGVRLSLEVPVSRLAKALGLLADALDVLGHVLRRRPELLAGLADRLGQPLQVDIAQVGLHD
jgi:predicted Zn-dependent peptidase